MLTIFFSLGPTNFLGGKENIIFAIDLRAGPVYLCRQASFSFAALSIQKTRDALEMDLEILNLNILNMVEPTRHFFDYYNKTIPQNWDEPALTDYDGDNSYTFGQMAAQMARLKCVLEAAGIEAGDKVVICSKNCANWAISLLSIAANKGVIVSVMDAFTGPDIEKLVNHSDAKAIFAGESVWKKIDIKNLPNIQLVLSTTDFSILYARTEKQQSAIGEGQRLFDEAYPHGYRKEDVNFPVDNLDELMIINYTSGTTSAPKGVMLSYRNISANATSADLVVLAETALQGTACKKDGAASPFAGDGRLLAMVQGGTGNAHGAGLSAEPKLSGSPVHTAGTGTEIAFFI